MFDENQLVKTKWNSKTKSYYELKGYIYTKVGDEFYVRAKDLKPSSHEQIKIICDFCGKPAYPRMIDYSKKKNKHIDSCDECKIIKTISLVRLRESEEKFRLLREVCDKNGYELLSNKDEYSGRDTPIKYICKKHGSQMQRLDVLLRGGICYYCAHEILAINQTFTPEYITQIVNSINGNELLNANEYVNSKTTNLRIRCGLCGNVFTCSFYAYTKLNQTRCVTCSKKESKPELEIRTFLENNNIVFEKEKRFDNCRDILPLPFDFYLPDYNLCIEFDGRQHYEPRFGEKDYLRTVKHDNIKNEYCKNNNINLLRIPYWEGNNIDDILIKQLNL